MYCTYTLRHAATTSPEHCPLLAIVHYLLMFTYSMIWLALTLNDPTVLYSKSDSKGQDNEAT